MCYNRYSRPDAGGCAWFIGGATRMEIRMLQGVEGARKAAGSAVVIDVFRAFSLENYLFAAGVSRILPVGREETARELKRRMPEALLVGERLGVKLPGFDYGNSPWQIREAALPGRTVIHTTSAGTQGIAAAAAAGADEILPSAMVNARAVAEYLLKKRPAVVSICCMGLNGREEAPEDTICGNWIRDWLVGRTPDIERDLARLREDPTVARFFDPDKQWVFPEGDYHMSTDADRFDQVLSAVRLDEDIFETKVIF